MQKNINNLSQIILYVDEKGKDTAFCEICTNTSPKMDHIIVTVMCYVNNTTYSMYHENIADVVQNDMVYSTLIVTDSKEIAGYAIKDDLAVAGLWNENNKDVIFENVDYVFEGIDGLEMESLNRVWQRCRKIPWTIAKTKRLIIREHSLDDIDAIYELYADEEAKKYMDVPDKDKLAGRTYLEEYIEKQYRFYEFGIWALIDEESGELIGRAGISVREDRDDLELGYIIRKSHRMNGYAKEACEAILKYAADELELKKMSAIVNGENVASIKLLEKLGFVEDGRHKIGGINHKIMVKYLDIV